MSAITLNQDQEKVFDQLKRFVNNDTHEVLILKGYAGTGKTFLMQEFANYLAGRKIRFSLLATTGRAATVLSGKTKFEARTVHSCIYFFAEVEGEEAKDAKAEQGQMLLNFGLKKIDQNDRIGIYIIDEASMLSFQQSIGDFANFGTGSLLTDFFQVTAGSKVVFVGDPCQLPPINELTSPALNKSFLEATFQKRVVETSLTQIVRQEASNSILQLATNIRQRLENPQYVAPKYPKLSILAGYNILVVSTEQQLLKEYYETIVNKESTIGLCTNNKQCRLINDHVRKMKHGNPNAPLQLGDVLLATQNNYLVPIMNGDFLEVKSIGNRKIHCQIKYVEVIVKHLITEKEHAVLLAESVLEGAFGTNITADQHTSLMVQFTREMRERGIKQNSEEYKNHLAKDPFLNALKAVYGYAVTYHKAQGGEWDKAFLFLQGSMYNPTDVLKTNLHKGWYTAVTRAKKQLFLHHDYWIEQFSMKN